MNRQKLNKLVLFSLVVLLPAYSYKAFPNGVWRYKPASDGC